MTDELAKLRAENERLREELEIMADEVGSLSGDFQHRAKLLLATLNKPAETE